MPDVAEPEEDEPEEDEPEEDEPDDVPPDDDPASLAAPPDAPSLPPPDPVEDDVSDAEELERESVR